MSVRKYVSAFDTLTAAELTGLMAQQPLAFADHTARDNALIALPDDVESESTGQTGSPFPALPAVRASYLFNTPAGLALQGAAVHQLQFRRTGQVRIDFATVFTSPPDGGIRFQVWADDRPTQRIELLIADAQILETGQAVPGSRLRWLNTSLTAGFFRAGVNYSFRFYTPGGITSELRNGVLGITLNDNKWWIHSSGRWLALGGPPPQERVITVPGIRQWPARNIGFDQAPAAINGRELWLAALDGRVPIPLADGTLTPFSEQLSSNPVTYLDGVTHIIDRSRTVTIASDCVLQLAGIGAGGSGQSYSPPGSSNNGDDPHTFGAAGGGAGLFQEAVVFARKGQRLVIQGASGRATLDGRTVLHGQPGGRGGATAAQLGSSGGGAAKNANQTGADPDQTAAPILALPYPWVSSRRNRGTDGSGRIDSTSSHRARGGDGGSSLTPHNLRWVPYTTAADGTITGGIPMGEGGQGGSHLRAGRAGVGYGAGGGGGGGGRADDKNPVSVEVLYDVNPFGQALNRVEFTIAGTYTPGGVGTEQTRYRYNVRTEESHLAGVPTSGWSDWTDWTDGNAVGQLTVGHQYRTVIIQAEARVARTGGRPASASVTNSPGQYIDIIAFSVAPYGLSGTIRSQGDSDVRIVFSVRQVGFIGRPGINFTTGIRYQVRFQTADGDGTFGDWSEWTPAPSGGRARWQRDNTVIYPVGGNVQPHRITVLEVQAQASNHIGQTGIVNIGSWTRAAAPVEPPPPPAEPTVVLPPADPTVTNVYNQASGTVLFSWESAEGGTAGPAEQYRYNWLQTNRDGTQQSGPGPGDEGWSAWGSGQSYSARIGPTVAQFSLEVEARNRRDPSIVGYTDLANVQTSGIGRSSRSFAAAPTPEQPGVTITPPATPTVTLGALTGGNIPVSWAAARADTYRWRRTFTTSAGTSTTSGWSSWTSATRISLNIPTNVNVVTVQVQARNGTSPNFNLSGIGRRTWTRPTPGAPPSITSVSITNPGLVGNTLTFRLTIRAVNANRYQYRVTSGSTVLRNWTTASSASAYNVSITSAAVAAAARGTITVTARAIGTVSPPATRTTTWTPTGDVKTPVISISRSDNPVGVGDLISVSWTAEGATQYRYRFADQTGVYGVWSSWGPTNRATRTIPLTQTRFIAQVEARANAGSLAVSSTAVWNRPVTPTPPTPPTPGQPTPPPTTPTQPPGTPRIRLTIGRSGWRASWTADGTGLNYTYQLTWRLSEEAGALRTLPAVQVGTDLTAAGGFLRGAISLTIRVTATNAAGLSSSASTTRSFSLAPVITDAHLSVDILDGSALRLVSMFENVTHYRYIIRSLPTGSSASLGASNWTNVRANATGGDVKIPLLRTGGPGTVVVDYEVRNSFDSATRRVTYFLSGPAPPRAPSISLTVTGQTEANISVRLTMRSPGTNQYRFRVQNTDGDLVLNWSDWRSGGVRTFQMASQARRVSRTFDIITVLAAARQGATGQSSGIRSVTYDPYGGVHSLGLRDRQQNIGFIPPNVSLSGRIVSENAGQFWYSWTIGGRTVAPGWSSNPVISARVNLLRIPTTQTLIIRARRGPGFAYRELRQDIDVIGSQRQAPPPEPTYRHAPPPPGGLPDGYVPPPEYEQHPGDEPETAEQTTTFRGGLRRTGVVVVRHAVYGRPLRILPV